MRLALVGLVVSSSAFAQPAPAPVPAPEQAVEPQEASSLALRAALGFGHYQESGPGWKWETDLQPFAAVGAEAALTAGRGHVVLHGQAGFGSDVDMSSSGQLDQSNGFHQQIFEGGVRYRHPLKPRIYLEGGYHLTYQRLYFTDITNNATGQNVGDAEEDVTVHGLEAGLGWRSTSDDGSRRHFAIIVGLNRGSAENSRITGGDFSARGISFDLRGGKRWASGMQLEGQFAYRKQNGSDPTMATFDGMPVEAMWPKNVTWQLLGVLGLAL